MTQTRKAPPIWRKNEPELSDAELRALMALARRPDRAFDIEVHKLLAWYLQVTLSVADQLWRTLLRDGLIHPNGRTTTEGAAMVVREKLRQKRRSRARRIEVTP